MLRAGSTQLGQHWLGEDVVWKLDTLCVNSCASSGFCCVDSDMIGLLFF